MANTYVKMVGSYSVYSTGVGRFRIQNVRSAGMTETQTSYPALPTYAQMKSAFGCSPNANLSIEMNDEEDIGTFEDCSKMTTSPLIPNDWINSAGIYCHSTYSNCSALTSFPSFPINTYDLDFRYCTNITGTLKVPRCCDDVVLTGTTKTIRLEGCNEQVLIDAKNGKSNITYTVINNSLMQIKMNNAWYNSKDLFVKVKLPFPSTSIEWVQVKCMFYKENGEWKRCQIL